MTEELSEKLELEKQISDLVSIAEKDLQAIFITASVEAEQYLRVFHQDITNLLKKLNIRIVDFDDPTTDTQQANQILILVANHFEVSVEELLGRNRSRGFAVPRQIVMYLIYRFVPISTSWLANFFDNRDHTTICSAIQRIEKLIEEDKKLSKQIELLELQINAQPTARKKNPRKGVKVSPEQLENIRIGVRQKKERDARAATHH